MIYSLFVSCTALIRQAKSTCVDVVNVLTLQTVDDQLTEMASPHTSSLPSAGLRVSNDLKLTICSGCVSMMMRMGLCLQMCRLPAQQQQAVRACNRTALVPAGHLMLLAGVCSSKTFCVVFVCTLALCEATSGVQSGIRTSEVTSEVQPVRVSRLRRQL